MRCLFLIIIFFIFTASSIAGPFGTDMGDKKDKFHGLRQMNDGGYQTQSIPKPNPIFENYLLYFENSGLHTIKAASKSYSRAELNSAKVCYSNLENSLTEKYGAPSDSTANLSYVEKSKLPPVTIWNKNLPDNLASIELVLYSGGQQNIVLLTYIYKNGQEKRNIDALKKKEQQTRQEQINKDTL